MRPPSRNTISTAARPAGAATSAGSKRSMAEYCTRTEPPEAESTLRHAKDNARNSRRDSAQTDSPSYRTSHEAGASACPSGRGGESGRVMVFMAATTVPSGPERTVDRAGCHSVSMGPGPQPRLGFPAHPPMTPTMTPCPSCRFLLPAGSPTCRFCGAAAVTDGGPDRPASVAGTGPGLADLLPPPLSSEPSSRAMSDGRVSLLTIERAPVSGPDAWDRRHRDGDPGRRQRTAVALIGIAALAALGFLVVVMFQDRAEAQRLADRRWTRFTAIDRSFTASVPELPATGETTLTLPDGTTTPATTHRIRTASDSTATVVVASLPFAPAPPVLDSVADGVVAAIAGPGARVDRRDAATLGTVASIRVAGAVSGDGTTYSLRGDVAVVGDRLVAIVGVEHPDDGAVAVNVYDRIRADLTPAG